MVDRRFGPELFRRELVQTAVADQIPGWLLGSVHAGQADAVDAGAGYHPPHGHAHSWPHRYSGSLPSVSGP